MVESSPSVDSVIEKSQLERIPKKSQESFNDHLANELTFLAWIRTSLGIFAFGCAIAQFGGSNQIEIISKKSFHEMRPIVSPFVLIGCGILTLLYGIYRYYRINRQITHNNILEVSQIREPVIATLVLFVSMIVILTIFIIL
jgi:putative membrane protein